MLSPVVIGALIQTGIVIILCVGFTFTYMVEKFPNFAHTATSHIRNGAKLHARPDLRLRPLRRRSPSQCSSAGLISLVLYVA